MKGKMTKLSLKNALWMEHSSMHFWIRKIPSRIYNPKCINTFRIAQSSMFF